MGVLVGSAPGRSSSSFVLSLLGVTGIDPLVHDLPFDQVLLEREPLNVVVDIPSRRLDEVAQRLGAAGTSTSIRRIAVDGAVIGIRGLEVLDRDEVALATLAESGVGLARLEDIAADDALAYDLLCSGSDFHGHWFDSLSARRVLWELQPRTLGQLAVAVAVNRAFFPWQVQVLAKRIRGGTWAAVDPALDDITRDTCGIFVFEEQVLRAAALVGGFDSEQVSRLTEALRTMQSDEMARLHREFMSGAEGLGHTVDTADVVWHEIESCGGKTRSLPAATPCLSLSSSTDTHT
jgi:DNA polymerase III alpha subunit